jgi:hypothetical protein
MKVLQSLHNSIQSLNNSIYFSGLMMIILNIGSKYITIELSKNQAELLKHEVMRQLLLFSIIWIGTKDIYVSLGLTAAFLIMSDYLFNEESSFCILPDYMIKINKLIDTNNDNKVSEIEIQKAIEVLEKAKREKSQKQQLEFLQSFQSKL